MDPFTRSGAELETFLAGEPRYRIAQVRAWLARGVDDPQAMTDLPVTLRASLHEHLDPPPRVVRRSVADDGLTHKVLLEMGAGERREAVESVLMLYPRTARRRSARATVCVSTQAGCAMGCPFCATGQAGFRRQLTVGEIVRQVTVMQRLLAERGAAGRDGLGPDGSPASATPWPDVPDHVTNVVFMGMGEPLANLEPSLDAVRWLVGQFGLSARSITVSTIGLVPGIRRLEGLGLPVRLAISLHAPNDALRNDLVPANRQFPLREVMESASSYRRTIGRRVSFEYVLIDGLNDQPQHARELAALLARSDAHVNLIPMNPTPAVPWQAPDPAVQRRFTDVLHDNGVAATIRHNRGTEIDAACGQLYANYRMGSGARLPVAVGAAERLTAGDPG
ncbi:MAG: 23S rRNA (adenine(2503)-C(2))-methyltransferase RlmN [Egibacteraceae bacterium]